MARWVTIREDAFPIDYKMPTSNAWLHFNWDHGDPDEKGERYLPDDQADFMLKRGYAVEGKATKDSATKSRKGKTVRRKAVKNAANAAADNRSNARVDERDLASADSAGDRSGVDQASG